ncbi:acetyl-CoA carboxylase carboxyltransferase subunit alpha [Miniphocaeibacter massiliensis]|uniref:acetyl-CoA carboxylase carboxyltransferase subunit alpha n=1 Tax=Miniphocaeibacter massiliensis TaxID=2041841 RepID=UPI000C1C4988|nr:acetyl-CoA carboxylase carboxyltransferase subunit alpha [Miniphocaeibacter massiliensis]
MIKEIEKQINELNSQMNEFIKIDDEKLKEKLSEEIVIRRKDILKEASKDLSAYDRVHLARHKNRPKSKDYIQYLFNNVIEFKGDRLFKDDKSIIGGIATYHGVPITFIGTNKGKDTKENIEMNFGMASPEGYRKAIRLMEQADKFNRPIITFIDTPGAYPGIGAEERGQGEAIARAIMTMTSLKVPVISVITGEGGSGGALALGVGNKVIMMENAIYSILSPEGFSSILWKDSSRAEEATEYMKLTSHDLLEMNIVDRVVKEDICFCEEDFKDNFNRLDLILKDELSNLLKHTKNELQSERVKKFRAYGA